MVDDGFTSWLTPNLFITPRSYTFWSEQSQGISLRWRISWKNFQNRRRHTEVSVDISKTPIIKLKRVVVNLLEVRKGLGELRDGLKSIRNELQDHFADIESSDPNDLYGKKMWLFVGEAGERLDDLVDEVTLADSSYGEVVRYYGEDDRNMTSIEFFGIFKTFVTSYKVRFHFHFICAELTWIPPEMQDGQPDVR